MSTTISAEIARYVQAAGPWMVWNALLALLPWALALVIFDRAARPGKLWWLGAVACLIFLPNTAYVLTDIVHLPREVRAQTSDLVVLGVVLPTFAALFAIGFFAYVDIVRRFVAWLRVHGRARLAPAVVIAAHAVTAVAIYAGRVQRLNSWDVVLRPADVIAKTAVGFGRPFALIGMIIVFAFLTVGYAATVFVLDALNKAIAKPMKI